MTPKRRIIPVFVPHAGCPHDCVFCNQRRISGAMVPATAETVRDTMEKARAGLPVGAGAELAFYGGSFTAIPAHEQEQLLGAAQPYLKDGTITSIRLSTRPDCVADTDIERLLRYGVKTVELGVQSMDAEVLRLSGRGHTSEDAVLATALLKSAGFKVILQMMTGLPGDTPEKSIATARRIAALKPSGVRIYPTVIVRDTALFDMWRRGEYREHTVDEAADLCARLLDIFEHSGIPVIRLGLNPSDELSGGGAVAGAYAPAFGEIVQSSRYLCKARNLLSGTSGGDVVLGVAPGQISAMTGQKRANIKALVSEFS
ncbi:MAG: elongator complex protein 3, partial [Oscillospiraceae bacterium]